MRQQLKNSRKNSHFSKAFKNNRILIFTAFFSNNLLPVSIDFFSVLR